MGLVDTSTSCPTWYQKERTAWRKFCETLWHHGLSVAALDWEATSAAVEKVGVS